MKSTDICILILVLGFLTRQSDFCRFRCPPCSAYPHSVRTHKPSNTDKHQAARDVCSSQETLIDLFERIEFFFLRLEIYTEVSPTPEIMDMMVKIMVEVLSILGIATKEIRQGRTRE